MKRNVISRLLTTITMIKLDNGVNPNLFPNKIILSIGLGDNPNLYQDKILLRCLIKSCGNISRKRVNYNKKLTPLVDAYERIGDVYKPIKYIRIK